MQFQEWMFDRRVVERNLRKGTITRAEYEKYLGTMPDAADNVAQSDDPLEPTDEEAEGEKASGEGE